MADDDTVLRGVVPVVWCHSLGHEGNDAARAGRWLNVGQPPQASDYAMVLNGDPETRPFAAADLYRQGIAKRILITSIRGKARQTAQPKPHEVVRKILTRCGVRESDIDFVDSRCSSTFDEAKTLEVFLSSHPGVTVSVVTNEYHTRRTRWVFRRVLGSKMKQIRMVGAMTAEFNVSNWWKHEDGFVWYLSELFKFGFYWVRYGSGFVWMTATLGLIGIGWWVRRRNTADVSVI